MSTNNKYLAEEYQGRINKVMDFIELNLDKSFTLEELADVASFSKFHFSRIFWAMRGETPFVFLNRIRMEKAASLLVMNPKETISEIAYQCGFSSLPVFSRKFKAHFNCTAMSWRDGQKESNQSQTQSNNSKTYQTTPSYFSEQYEPLKWRTNMELNKGVEIKDFPKTTVAYVRHTGPYKGDEKLFERLYGELFAWAGPRGLMSQDGMKTFNIYHDDTKVDGKMGKMVLDEGKYAFAHFELPPTDYEKAWSWLFGEWFPASGYQPADGPCFEMCGAMKEGGLHVVDICVPVKAM
jgi:AraC family transcriptional regulator